MLLVTSSREPISIIRSLAKDLHKVIPQSIRLSRGKMSIESLTETMLNLNTSKLLMINRWKGNPGKIEFYEIEDSNLKLIPPILYLKRVILGREFCRQQSRIRYSKLAIAMPKNDKFVRLAESLSRIFNVPFADRDSDYPVFLKIVEDKKGQPKITFYNGASNEIGPAIYFREIQWNVNFQRG